MEKITLGKFNKLAKAYKNSRPDHFVFKILMINKELILGVCSCDKK